MACIRCDGRRASGATDGVHPGVADGVHPGVADGVHPVRRTAVTIALTDRVAATTGKRRF
jgi:hypothetical protein